MKKTTNKSDFWYGSGSGYSLRPLKYIKVNQKKLAALQKIQHTWLLLDRAAFKKSEHQLPWLKYFGWKKVILQVDRKVAQNCAWLVQLVPAKS